MLIRKTEVGDIPAAVKIYDEARKYMAAQGNPDQWRDGYPSENDILSDISDGASYVCEADGEVVAVFYFKVGREPDYDKIYEGEWKNSLPYAAIHRIAVKHHGRGIVKFCFDECFKLYPNLKIDTHRCNLPMQSALKKAGFVPCGIIYLENGEERLAFQKQ